VLFTVQLTPPDRPRESFEVPPAGVTRTISRDTAMHVQALGSDPESGVIRSEIRGDLFKTCDIGGGMGQIRKGTQLIQEPPSGPAPTPLTHLGVGHDFTFDDVKCQSQGDVTIAMRGELRAVITNGAGAQTTSGWWKYSYQLP
jgi:hypothetical protein